MSPAEKAAREEMLDAKMRELAGKAYDKAMPMPDTTFGKPKRELPPLIDTRERDPATLAPKKKPPTAEMKKGGSVSSASKRADGIATKGKTKGTMVKMTYGGKC
jgi:hypothetical protein